MIRIWGVTVAAMAFCTDFSPSAVSAFSPIAPLRSSRTMPLHMSNLNVIVVSPPAGLGETIAVRAASLGSRVRWFVISSDNSDGSDSSTKLILSPTIRKELEASGGSIDLAGCPASDLTGENGSNAAATAADALRSWIGGSSASSIGAIIATEDDGTDSDSGICGRAARVAARVALAAVSQTCRTVAVVPLGTGSGEGKEEGGKFFLPGAISGLLGGSEVTIPPTLPFALGGVPDVTVSHAALFGVPETRSDACPLVGGPLRTPVVRDEYTMRGVLCSLPPRRTSGDDRSSRLAVGEAAARLAVAGDEDAPVPTEVYVASLSGTQTPSQEVWAEKFEGVISATSSARDGAILFETSFSSVPNVPRLAEWIASKWYPAVTKSYDIASIRTGARPVYATVVDGNNVEIVWQILKDFEARTLDAKMVITVKDDGLKAVRIGLDRETQLKGEDVLVRRLSDAALQAVEKGLAIGAMTKAEEKKPVSVPVASRSPQTLSSTGAPADSSGSGPRTAGARRSSERPRRRKRSDTAKTEEE
mmetsp:Transcript_1206/g.2442  ORF Transcript_1206/g.2442 Transcript_1206/m.2442 type:complete len:533 (-) Transcript_1206:40-1638(-)|eukprot:CAMPEP_0113313058 /NCGR_PEP_ID=MMETSP0010_2-20120614/9632_1 /TAXON_ID=216773 ORGANISM="Corethron hystrix, Strain 308" /NCGR_SAMPLE_ID=MMETSP0010_2 /ASSEMBLY_ACC=CAM_ASM_000155 /LENGTH=532 /DNA_ID=CAMNT_0000168991 /DNA_START=59 /DNA_END=1660 /DNA_ORIENTATION=- /assembly_acc=CAM_ASM_000155